MRRALVLCWTLVVCLLPALVRAGEAPYVAVCEVDLGETMTKAQARELARSRAVREALESAAMAVWGATWVRDGRVERDDIVSSLSAACRVDILEERGEARDNAFSWRVKVRVWTDPQEAVYRRVWDKLDEAFENFCDWKLDPKFMDLPVEGKNNIYSNYFKRRIDGYEFRLLSPEQQQTIKQRFDELH